MFDPLYVLGVLCLCVALSEWLVQRSFLRHLGSALLVILVGALVVNLGLIPTYSAETEVYDVIFGTLAPLAIFWLLLGVNLRRLARVGPLLLGLFLLGSLATAVGVWLGLKVVDGPEAFGEHFAALGGMFVGTYTGGSVNFGAVAIEYGVMREGPLFLGATAVDNAATTVWMALCVALPRFLGPLWPGQRRATASEPLQKKAAISGIEEDTEAVHPFDLGLIVALGAFALWVSRLLAQELEARFGFDVPAILILTSIALVLAQLPIASKLAGARLCGMFAVMLFLAVIGALCDVDALRAIGPLGLNLTIFVATVVGVHGLIVFGTAFLLRLDPDLAAVASQANIGGGTSALALARSLGRADLVLPAILIGSLGTALGTYLGIATVELLG